MVNFHSLVYQKRVLIELYSDKLPVALDLVRLCLLRVWVKLSYQFLTPSFYNATQMPQTPTLIIVTIAATRLYRSLINFGSSEM